MAYLTKTFRKSGTHHAESSAIDGVEIKIGEKFRPPKKVTLPVGWHQNDPSEALSLTYDFTLEKEVLRKAEEEKARKEEEAAIVAEAAMAVTTQSDTRKSISPESESASKPNPVFTNMGMDILTPVTVSGSGHKRADSLGSKGTNAFEISDFEGEAFTPFELVELQTINDMDVLKTVLATTMRGECAQPSSDSFTVTAPSSAEMSSASVAATETIDHSSNNYLVNISSNTAANCNISTVAQSANTDLTRTSDTHGNTLIDISEPRREMANPKEPISMPVNSNSGLPHSLPKTPVPLPRAAKPVAPQNQVFSIPQLPGQNPLLVGIEKQNQPSCVSATGPHSAPVFSSAAGQSSLTSQASPAHRDQTPHGILHLPPLQSPPQIPPRPWVQAASRGPTSVDGGNMNSGVRVMPSNSGLLPYPSNSSSAPLARSGPIASPSPEPSLPQVGIPRQHPSPLPPISSPVPPDDSSLPDPWPVLSESERALVTSIASMGFPGPRVARAVQRLGEKDREIVDFLFAVDEVSQLGYPADSAEVALTLNSMDKTKAVEFLELEKSFKEWGFKRDNIQEALRAADNDRDKALDYLMTLQSPA